MKLSPSLYKYAFGPFFVKWFSEGPPRFTYSDTVLTIGISFFGYTVSFSWNITIPLNK